MSRSPRDFESCQPLARFVQITTDSHRFARLAGRSLPDNNRFFLTTTDSFDTVLTQPDSCVPQGSERQIAEDISEDSEYEYSGTTARCSAACPLRYSLGITSPCVPPEARLDFRRGSAYFDSTLTALSSLGCPPSIWTTLTAWSPSPFAVKAKVPSTPW